MSDNKNIDKNIICAMLKVIKLLNHDNDAVRKRAIVALHRLGLYELSFSPGPNSLISGLATSSTTIHVLVAAPLWD